MRLAPATQTAPSSATAAGAILRWQGDLTLLSFGVPMQCPVNPKRLLKSWEIAKERMGFIKVRDDTGILGLLLINDQEIS